MDGVVVADYADDTNSYETFKFPYGSIGDYFWVKEPFVSIRDRRNGGRRVRYLSKCGKSVSKYGEILPASKMTIRESRKVLELKDIDIVQDMTGNGYWALAFSVLTSK